MFRHHNITTLNNPKTNCSILQTIINNHFQTQMKHKNLNFNNMIQMI